MAVTKLKKRNAKKYPFGDIFCYNVLMKLEFLPIKTRVVLPPKDDIYDILDSLDIKDGDIIFITSKIISIHQGNTVKVGSISKEDLIRREADRYLDYYNDTGKFHVNLTVIQNTLIPAAGIDESNANGYYVTWPHDIDKTCAEFRDYLIKKHGIKHLGVIATDSHSMPLRLGVTGIAIGIAGIEPINDIRGTEDLFGRKMHITRVDMIDPLASMAVLLMGESNESTPIVILRNYKNIVFSETGSTKHFKLSPEDDLYKAIIEVIPKCDN